MEDMRLDQAHCNGNNHVPRTSSENTILFKVSILSSHAIVSELTYRQWSVRVVLV